jgi:hypothetical protein
LTATIPVELKLRMWLPAMPVKTRWICVGHQLGFLERALDALDRRLDVDHDPFLRPFES